MNNTLPTGIDLILEQTDKYIQNRNFALITGSSVINAENNPVFIEFKEKAGRFFKEIWSLQHGFFIDKQDNMILSPSVFSEEYNLEIKSFYNQKLVPGNHDLDEIELIIIDVFDVGTRVYTFLNHIIMILKELEGKDIKILIADRPNPVGGSHLEGNCSIPAYFSIVSMIDCPMRHGLTAGEFIRYGVDYHQINIDLDIVQIPKWRRSGFLTGPWTMPSPNMPCLNTAVIYPGAVLLEGTNLSEGRGTTRPFEMFGAPFIDNISLCHYLRSCQFKGVDFSPIFFKPEFSKFKDKTCKGILVHILNQPEVKSFEIFYELIRILYHQYPGEFIFHDQAYEFEYQRPAIDMICGSDMIRQAIQKDLPFTDLVPVLKKEHSTFRETIRPFLLY